MRPNTFLIGAMRAGTTSLANALSAHPDVFVPKNKEPNFHIGSQDARQAARYLALYRSASDEIVRLDASTTYTIPQNLERAAKSVREWDGSARAIYLVRDPVRRAVSHYVHHVLLGIESEAADQAISPTSNYVQQSDYPAAVRIWRTALSSDHVLVVDVTQSDATPALERVQTFLGVDPCIQSLSVHYTSASRSADGRMAAAARDSAFGEWLRSHTRPQTRQRLRSLKPSSRRADALLRSAEQFELDADLTRRLMEGYQEVLSH